ncbi:MAG: helix-turn-helix domain-containing protein, partial [Gammaproteobacteria bacterium]|nr:helix-turn-helix domain-containing protein [Gammaproteobacteria bacterium]
MNQQEAQQGEQLPPKQGPGDVLQTARISVGLTLEEVARKMHLSVGILSSLEENKFEDITAPIFVKGYLRAYSRLVQVNEDDVIEQYSRFYMDGDPPITSTSN